MATVTRPTHMDFLLDLQNQWIIGIIAFFILSLLFGTAFGSEADWPYTLGWVICGVFALIFITQAFPDVWNFTFWLIGIYVLSTVGLFSLLIFTTVYFVKVDVVVQSEGYWIETLYLTELHFSPKSISAFFAEQIVTTEKQK